MQTFRVWALVQDDVKVFQTWQDFTQHPYRKNQQALAQRLLAQLLDQGLPPAAAQSGERRGANNLISVKPSV